MTSFDKNVLLALVTLSMLIVVPLAFAGLPSPFEGIGVVPIVLCVEVLIYFISVMVTNNRASAAMAAGSAIVFAILRALGSFAGAIAYGFFPGGTHADAALLWVNPVSTVIQVLLLLVAGPYLLALFAPDLVGRENAERLKGGDAPIVPRPAGGGSSTDTAPTGGFIQVFSFEELTAQMKKSPGLEGFIIFNDEGFVVWRDMPLKLDVEVLTARITEGCRSMGAVMNAGGLSRFRRLSVESRDHQLHSATLNQSFGLILIFSNRSSSDELQSRVPMLVKTAREFLQWKYPSLPMAAGMSRDRISLEAL